MGRGREVRGPGTLGLREVRSPRKRRGNRILGQGWQPERNKHGLPITLWVWSGGLAAPTALTRGNWEIALTVLSLLRAQRLAFLFLVGIDLGGGNDSLARTVSTLVDSLI